MKPYLSMLALSPTRFLVWVMATKGAYIAAHVIIGLALLWEAWKFVRLTAAASRPVAYFGYFLLAGVATAAICVCVVRIYERVLR
jgi:hypothetical protein